MPVNAQDFRVIAENCSEDGTEIGYRNCVSRAYYAMYHAVHSIITQEIPNYANGGSHFRLHEHLQDRNNGEPYDKSRMRQLAYVLRQCKENRFRADYDLEYSLVDQHLAEDMLNRADLVLSSCDELSKAA